MPIPLAPTTLTPRSGRRHINEDATARREEMELLRYQQQLETLSRNVTPAAGASMSGSASYGSPLGINRTNMPNSILAHYIGDPTDEERATKRRHASQIANKDDAATRALQSKLLEDTIRAEQRAQIELNKQIKEEQQRKNKALDDMVLQNASIARQQANDASISRKMKARDLGMDLLEAAHGHKLTKDEQKLMEKEMDKLEATANAEEHVRQQAAKKDYHRQIALADQQLWEHQRNLQFHKNAPSTKLSPREALQMHIEEDADIISDREARDRLLAERAAEEQRAQEEKVFKQLALISAGTDSTVKMATPRHHGRLEAINHIGASKGMIQHLAEGDDQRNQRTDNLRKADAHYLENVIKSTSPKMPQNGFKNWTTAGSQLASSPRTEGAAKTIETAGMTMVEKLAAEADAEKLRRKQDGRHIQNIQRIQADQRKLETETAKAYDLQAEAMRGMERKAQEDALNNHLEGMLQVHGVNTGSPKAHRLKALDSPRRNPGPGAYGNYESRSNPLRASPPKGSPKGASPRMK